MRAAIVGSGTNLIHAGPFKPVTYSLKGSNLSFAPRQLHFQIMIIIVKIIKINT